MPLYWLCYRHNNHARMREKLALHREASQTVRFDAGDHYGKGKSITNDR